MTIGRPREAQIDDACIGALNNSNSKILKEVGVDESGLWEDYLLIFPEGTKLTVEGIHDSEDERKAGIPPTRFIDAFSGFNTVNPPELIFKSDDYLSVMALIDERGFQVEAKTRREDAQASMYGF